MTFDTEFTQLLNKDDRKESIENLLLAHYTSISSALKIIESEEVWLSNPYLMNDSTELWYGIRLAEEVLKSKADQLGAVSSKYNVGTDFFYQYFYQLTNWFYSDQFLDTYIFCCSKHDSGKTDGLLSMWRGYGDNGSGVAIVFNTNFIDRSGKSPLILSKVDYQSRQDREQALSELIGKWIMAVTDTNDPQADNDGKFINHAFEWLFSVILMKSISTKHLGFSEEREWRIIYMKYRDNCDRLSRYLHYNIHARNGVEPKLKLPVKPITEHYTWSISDIIEKIIIGPSASSDFAIASFRRALQCIGKGRLIDKVSFSDIPFRGRFN